MTDDHDRALLNPSDAERQVVTLMHVAGHLIEQGYADDPVFATAVRHIALATHVLSDQYIGRLDRLRVQEYARQVLLRCSA